LGLDCNRFADYLLSEAGVATLPGTHFGEFGQGYLRLSYATSVENIKKGLDRISLAVTQICI
jgi:aspartate/methionine/tyrosine aminotransferase